MPNDTKRLMNCEAEHQPFEIPQHQKIISPLYIKGGERHSINKASKCHGPLMSRASAAKGPPRFGPRANAEKRLHTAIFSGCIRAATSMENARKPSCTNGFRAFPHPLQNRVPRVRVLLPLPKNKTPHFAVSYFFVSGSKDSKGRQENAVVRRF